MSPFTAVSGIFTLGVSAVAITTQLPAKFDLRNVNGTNYVTSVKSQQGGTCWTHGAMSAFEGNLTITGTWKKIEDTSDAKLREAGLAEYHLDWWNGFNNKWNPDFTNPSGYLTLHDGGNYRMVAAYVVRLDGPVRDIDGQSYNTQPKKNSDTYHRYFPTDIIWYDVGDDESKLDTIKANLMRCGVVATGYCCGFGDTKQYQPKSSTRGPDHAVSIVGWDDEMAIPNAPKKGAWLVKNSWGTSFGDKGYFWISYFDKHCCHHYDIGACHYLNVDTLKYDSVYFHDAHGWRDTKADCREAFNCFKAVANEYIAAVGFYTGADDVDYSVTIYGSFNGTELSGELAKLSGHAVHRGFHVRDLPKAVSVDKGNNFYVYVKLATGGHPYDRTSKIDCVTGAYPRAVVESKAEKGQSYYNDGGAWKDLYDYKDTSEYKNSSNFCIQAYSCKNMPISKVAASGGVHASDPRLQSATDPFSGITRLTCTIPRDADIALSVYSLDGRAVKTLIERQSRRGSFTAVWDWTNARGQPVAHGVYYAVLAVKTGASVRIIQGKIPLVR